MEEAWLPPPDPLRLEIAAVAARLIADHGMDFGSAKTRAARQVCGDGKVPRGVLPDNDEIDQALREHLELFDPDHDTRLAHQRQTALALMADLQAFEPMVTGGIWKGIALEDAPIHLQLFVDNAKEVEYHLLNAGLDYEAAEINHFNGRGQVPALALTWQGEPVMLSLYDFDAMRQAFRDRAGQPLRGNREALLARMAAS